MRRVPAAPGPRQITRFDTTFCPHRFGCSNEVLEEGRTAANGVPVCYKIIKYRPTHRVGMQVLIAADFRNV